MIAIPSARVDHVALHVPRLAWYVELFREVFGMTVTAEDTGDPHQVWFDGLQLIEHHSVVPAEGMLAHVAFGVEDAARVTSALARRGCTQLQRGPRWWSIGDGLIVELVDEAP